MPLLGAAVAVFLGAGLSADEAESDISMSEDVAVAAFFPAFRVERFELDALDELRLLDALVASLPFGLFCAFAVLATRTTSLSESDVSAESFPASPFGSNLAVEALLGFSTFLTA